MALATINSQLSQLTVASAGMVIGGWTMLAFFNHEQDAVVARAVKVALEAAAVSCAEQLEAAITHGTTLAVGLAFFGFLGGWHSCRQIVTTSHVREKQVCNVNYC